MATAPSGNQTETAIYGLSLGQEYQPPRVQDLGNFLYQSTATILYEHLAKNFKNKSQLQIYMYYEYRTRGTQRKVQKNVQKNQKNNKQKAKKVQLTTNMCTSCQSSL